MKEGLVPSRHMFTATKNEGLSQASSTQELVAAIFSSFCGTGALLAASSFISSHSMSGLCDNLTPARQLPILQEERDKPIQPDDVQRTVAHIVFSRIPWRNAFVFGPCFTFIFLMGNRISVCLPNKSSTTTLTIFSLFRYQVQTDKRALGASPEKKEGADVSYEEGG